MDLFIETLTGTAFELRVSPFETIMNVKAKIQRLEGKFKTPIYVSKTFNTFALMSVYCITDIANFCDSFSRSETTTSPKLLKTFIQGLMFCSLGNILCPEPPMILS